MVHVHIDGFFFHVQYLRSIFMNASTPFSTNRRQALRIAGAAAVALGAPSLVLAQSAGLYPERPVKIIVPFAPGAGTDAMGRLIAQKLGEIFTADNTARGGAAATFVVENRAGASGAIGTQAVAQAAPDGLTLLLIASPFTTVAASLPSAGYDPLRQFAPVGMVATGPLVWAANTKLAASNMRELVALAKQKPGTLNYGSAGAGGVNHLVLELLKVRTGTFITHIPYRGVAPAVMDMIGGQIDLVTGTVPALLPFIKAGTIKPLAVTSARRSSALPDVPSMAESGFADFNVLNYFGIMAPAGTPPAVVNALNAALQKMVLLPDVVARFKTDAVEAATGTPAQLAQFIEADLKGWQNVVKTQNLKLD